MIRVSKESLDHLRRELDQIATSAFFMETYTYGATGESVTAEKIYRWTRDSGDDAGQPGQ
jgi:hypothetical protein